MAGGVFVVGVVEVGDCRLVFVVMFVFSPVGGSTQWWDCVLEYFACGWCWCLGFGAPQKACGLVDGVSFLDTLCHEAVPLAEVSPCGRVVSYVGCAGLVVVDIFVELLCGCRVCNRVEMEFTCDVSDVYVYGVCGCCVVVVVLVVSGW